MVAFGMQLPIQSQSTIFVQPWEPSAGPAELVQVTQACEAAGFDYVAVCDHVAVPAAQADAMSTSWWDTIATLSYLAAVTERVRLLSHVYVLPYRHPLVVAKAWATLDALSGGRAILGVGAGHVEGEFDALEVPFAGPRPAARRGHRRRAGRPGRRVRRRTTANGGGSRASASARAPCSPRLPIWVGRFLQARPAPGGGARRRLAARRASPRAAWPLASTSSAPTGPRREATIRSCSARSPGPLHVGDPTWDTPRCVRGPADKIAAYLRTYADLGVDQIQVGFVSRSADELCDQIAAFADRRRPARERLRRCHARIPHARGAPAGVVHARGEGRPGVRASGRAWAGTSRCSSPATAPTSCSAPGGPRRPRQVAAEVRALGRRAEVVALDITDADACAAAVDRAARARSAASTSSSTTPSRTGTARRSWTRRWRSGG